MALKWSYGKIAIQGYPGQFLGIGNHDHPISQLSEHYNEPVPQDGLLYLKIDKTTVSPLPSASYFPYAICKHYSIPA